MQMMFRSFVLIASFSICSLVAVASARAGTMMVEFEFGLSTPTVTATEATFDVSLLFSGIAGDQIEAYQLSVFGSSPLLTASDTDFSRFGFSAASSPDPLDSWISLGLIGLTGLEPGIPLDPFFGPFITPSPTPLVLGTLAVDLTGIAPGTALNVTLADGFPGLETDVGGTFDGQFVDSVAALGDPNPIMFSEPDGVSFQTPGGVAPIPEPSSVLIWSCFGFVWFVRKRLAFALGRRARDSVLGTSPPWAYRLPR